MTASTPVVPLRLFSALVTLLMFALATTAGAQPGLEVVYGSRDAANAISDGPSGAQGLTTASRQGPIFTDARWPARRVIAKMSGAELSRLGPEGMVRALRARLADPASGGTVGVDELASADYGEANAEDLATALAILGPDAKRVVLYVGPGLVSQIGRVDPRRPLSARLSAVLRALRGAGAVQLETYHAGGIPFTRAEFAVYSTRWLTRWAPADPALLHLILGPPRGVTQKVLWWRARASVPGRTLLANGAGSYGLTTKVEGLNWLAGYTAFRANPTTPPPGGDVHVARGGTLAVSQPVRRRVTVVLGRKARAVMRLQPVIGGPGRTVAKLYGPTPAAGIVVRLPADVRPGWYWLVTVALGDDLRDVVITRVLVTRSWA